MYKLKRIFPFPQIYHYNLRETRKSDVFIVYYYYFITAKGYNVKYSHLEKNEI